MTVSLSTIKVHVTDFWSDFRFGDSDIGRILNQNYDIVRDAQDPDIVIFSCFGSEHLKYNCAKLFYTAESIVPDFNLCDYAIGFQHIAFEDRYLRYPNFNAEDVLVEGTAARKEMTKADLTSRRFCNFIYSNQRADPIRDAFFHALHDRRSVVSLGRHRKNTKESLSDRYGSSWSASKVEKQRQFNFSIAFENSASPGYVTEKLAHAFVAGTIPIYWGDPRIAEDFNPDAFIHLRDFGSVEACADYVVAVSQDAARMAAYLAQPIFRQAAVPAHLQIGRLEAFLRHICDQHANARSRRPRHGGMGSFYAEERRKERVILDRYNARKRALRHMRNALTLRPLRKRLGRHISR